jgi:hypothetical protein
MALAVNLDNTIGVGAMNVGVAVAAPALENMAAIGVPNKYLERASRPYGPVPKRVG